jgi:urease accessory protein
VTSHWPSPWPPAASASASSGSERKGRFDLDFMRHGPRTVIGRQHVSYPFHLTRPFCLDSAIPSLLTVYQQSASGGLYRADELACRYHLGAGAAAHVTTQAATVVHDCHGQPARQAIDVTLEDDAFLALVPDPLVLFPGASVASVLKARLAPGAVLLLADSFALHDPQAKGRPFDQLASEVSIRDAEERLLVRDCFRVQGAELAGPASPTGQWRIVSSFLLLGSQTRLPKRDVLTALDPGAGAVFGVSPLANGAGWGVRCLAADAVSARRVAEMLFSACVLTALGHLPAKRPK